jgi:hypothetical protein
MADPFELEIELKMAREELKHLPADDFNQRITLRDRILEIEAAIAAATPVAADSLQAELTALRARYHQMMRTRINPSMTNGGFGLAGGIDPNFLHKANRKIDEMTGIKGVEERILEIERILGESSRQ